QAALWCAVALLSGSLPFLLRVRTSPLGLPALFLWPISAPAVDDYGWPFHSISLLGSSAGAETGYKHRFSILVFESWLGRNCLRWMKGRLGERRRLCLTVVSSHIRQTQYMA